MATLPNGTALPENTLQLVSQLQQAVSRLQSPGQKLPASDQQRSGRRRLLADAGVNASQIDMQLERILAGNDLTDINYLAIGLACAQSVGRVVIRQNGVVAGYGTGFLIAPGVMMTNHHVFPTAKTAAESLLQMRYERDIKGQDLTPVSFRFDLNTAPVLSEALDFAIVAVQPVSTDGQKLEQFQWLPLNPQPGKAFVGEYLTIIQHPGGERKQICVRENRLIRYADNDPFVWYQTDTVGGSSGSPVFNTTWDVVALHHKGVPRVTKNNAILARDGSIWTKAMGESNIDWIANEGIRISSILAFLQDKHKDHPLVQAILGAGRPLRDETAALTRRQGNTAETVDPGIRVTQHSDGRTSILFPVELDLRLNTDRLTGRSNPSLPSESPAPPQVAGHADNRIPTSSDVESVKINRTNYAERNGYQPEFPGGSVRVPLPKVAGDRFGKPLKLRDGTTEIKYWNYSVVMNQDRRMAYFSAANIRTTEGKGTRDSGDFIEDERVREVDPNVQLTESFYKNNNFDQGHLTRRDDLQWGATSEEAKRNGDDSYHYTNCAPQHYAFNQNKKINGLWNRLETMAVHGVANSADLCIINGPVFDAPESAIQDGKVTKLNLQAPSKPDPLFNSVRIPKMFFKLIAWADSGKLNYRAFVVSQEALLKAEAGVTDQEAAGLTNAEISLYEIKVSALEKLTGLKFGLPKIKTSAAASNESIQFAESGETTRQITDEMDI